MKSLFDQFKNPKSVASCWETAKQEKMVSFFCKAPYDEGLVLIHNLTTIGGDRNTAVIGVGIDAFISQVDSLSLYKNNVATFSTPPWKDIENDTSIQDLLNLEPSPSSSPGNPKIIIRNCVPIPPFAFDILSEMDLKSPMSVLQNILVEMRKFDADTTNNTQMPVTMTEARPPIHWLLCCSQKTGANKPYVEEIGFFLSHNPKVLKYFSDINSCNLLPSQTAIVTGNASADCTSTVKDLNSNIHEQTSALEQIASINATKSSETKKSFAKLYDCQQKLVLVASYVDGLNSADSATEFAKEFYKQTSTQNAKLYLQNTLHSAFKCNVHISLGFATAIYQGLFYWDTPDTPSNFNCFNLTKPSPLKPSGWKEVTILDFKSNQSAGLNETDVKSVLKQHTIITKDVTGLLHCLNNTRCFCEFFFGEESLLTTSIKAIPEDLVENFEKHECQTAQQGVNLISGILFTVSNCINAFLEECWLKESRNKVDDTLLNFSTITRQIKLSQFYFFLPPPFKKLSDDSKTTESVDKQDVIKKRQGSSLQQEDKGNVKQKKEADRNDNLNPIWKLKSNEDYGKVFAGKCLTD